MLISLLLLNATKSKLYVHFMFFLVIPSQLSMSVLFFLFLQTVFYYIVLHCIYFFLISGCCKSCLQPSIPALLLHQLFLFYLLSK